MQFSTTSTRAKRASRYTCDKHVPTGEGGRVGVGVDKDANEYLVHEIGRSTEAISLPAVASAVVGGAIPLDVLVAAFQGEGKLPQLKAAVTRASK